MAIFWGLRSHLKGFESNLVGLEGRAILGAWKAMLGKIWGHLGVCGGHPTELRAILGPRSEARAKKSSQKLENDNTIDFHCFFVGLGLLTLQ